MDGLIEDATKVLADPTAYADEQRLHAGLAELRANAPVAWVDQRPYRPFWAITKHADIMAIERDHQLWINAPRSFLATAETEDIFNARLEAGTGANTLVRMDGPHHRAVRAIGADWFRPKAMRALKARVDELATRYVDEMAAKSTCDFVTDIAVNYPLYVIMSLLGIPEHDFGRMLKLTQELFGQDDSELQRDTSGDEPAAVAVMLDFFDYFQTLTTARRAHPTEDLASAIANARIDGEHLSDTDALSYYLIVATAGHDTTSSAISGGLHALIEHPDQLQRLRTHPELMRTAVEEIIRWTTPAKEFMRTATADTTVRGIDIAAGESVYLSYASGNRDEEVFDNPFRFDVGRDPNKHLAFGGGVHFCLGAALARMEINSFFAELVPRLGSIELAGIPELSATTFVGGLKHLPIRHNVN
jgi:cytochrome P450